MRCSLPSLPTSYFECVPPTPPHINLLIQSKPKSLCPPSLRSHLSLGFEKWKRSKRGHFASRCINRTSHSFLTILLSIVILPFSYHLSLSHCSFFFHSIFLLESLEQFCCYNLLLAQGQTQGSTPRAHQQALTTGPFGNTCEADAVSPEVAIGGCRTQVSTTRGNAEWIHNNNTQSPSILYLP
jgi:hypothetical protein